MVLKVGDTIPSGEFPYVPFDPAVKSPLVCGLPSVLKSDEWKGKKVVLFGLPGAFTRLCSANHAPGFIEKADQVKAKGVDTIACIDTNDLFVQSSWARVMNADDKVLFISDPEAKWLKAAGVTVDIPKFGLGTRSHRWAAIVDDLKVTYFGQEEDDDNLTVSGVDAILKELN